MSNGDTARKSHVKRIYKDDDPSSDQWIDVERLDELSFSSGRAEQFRRKVWKFNWDDFDPDGPNVTKKKIYDPKDENSFIEVPVRKSVLVKEGRGEQFQRYRHHFVNDATNETRKTTSRRIYHHEIKQGYLLGGEPPSDPDTYLKSLSDQDMSQYVEVELLNNYRTDQNENRDAQGHLKDSAWQVKKWVLTEADSLLQEPMLETDEVDPEFVPVNNPEEGPKVDPPWRLDPLQNIVNVSWGGGVIVVFVDASPEASQVSSSFNVIDHKATALTTFSAPYSEDGFMPGFACSAFKVSQNAGNFIKSTAPSATPPLGYGMLCCVFAIEDDTATSLERAVAGTKLIVPAIDLLSSSTGTSDLPANLFPPGLLWLVQTGMLDGGQILTWKMRHGNHREPTIGGGTDINPNPMTQCYHLENYTGPSGGVETITWSGYETYGYRLDKNGTGTVYGKRVWVEDAPNDQNIDPAWNQTIASNGTKGIPATDPPPLITADMET